MVVATVNFDPTKNLPATPASKDGTDVIDELLSSSQIITAEKDKEGDLIISKMPVKNDDILKALEEDLEVGRADETVVRIKVKDFMGVLGSNEAQLFVLSPTTTFGEFFIDVSCRFNLEMGHFDIIYQTKDFSHNLAGYSEDQTFEAIEVIPCPDKTYSMCLEVMKSTKKRKSKDIFNTSGDNLLSPGHDVDLAYAGALELSPLIKRDFVGLKNRNMTCYLNSFLQGLWFTPEFRNVIYSYLYDPSRSNKKSICAPLQKLFLLLQLSIRDSIDTDELIRTFGWADRETWMQHDIEELFSIVMESITKELVGTPLDGIIQALYFGQLYDYVKCLECNRVSQRTDDFLVVPLPIRNFGTPLPSPTLEAALNSFVAYEVLDGSNMYNCSQCEKPCCAHKGFKFSKLPYILTFQLKRFEYDFVRDKRFKLNDKVIFPFVLDMNPYIETPSEDRREALKTDALKPKSMKEGTERKGHTRPSVKPPEPDEGSEDTEATGAAAASEKPTVEMMLEMVKSKGPEIYQLYGVMVHRGGINSGHYFAYIMDFERGKWYRCDDAVIRQASVEDIQSTYGGDREEDKELTSAYMLLYRRFDPELNLLPYYLEEMPAHMQAMWTEMDQLDKQLHDEEELAKNAVKITCFAYGEEGTLVERSIQIPKNLKMSQAAKYVHEDFREEIPLRPGLVRLVRYDRDLEIIENSFENCDEDLIPVALKKVAPRTKNEALLLEWKPEGEQFVEVYRTNDIIFRTQKVDCLRQEMAGHIKEIHVEPGALMGDLKGKIQSIFGLSAGKLDMVLVAQYTGRFSTLFGDDNHPLSLYSFDKINNLYVHVGPGNDELSNKLLDFVEHYTKAEIMHMYVQLPDGFTIENLRNAKLVAAEGDQVNAQAAPAESQKQAVTVPAEEAAKIPNGEVTDLPEVGPAKTSEKNEQSENTPANQEEASKLTEASIVEPSTPKRPDCFIKLMSAVRAEQDNLALCEVRIDLQTPLYVLSKRISSWIPVEEKDFVLYKIDKDESTEMRRMTERISTIKPFDHLYVKLEHRLQDGEARLPIYKLNLGSITNPLEYLTDIVVTMAMSVDAVKAVVLEKTEICDAKTIDTSKVRIRKKIRTNPSKVLRPNTKLQDVFTASSIHCGELYVQLLNEPCPLTEKTHCLIYRRWHPSTGILDSPKEITVFHDYSTDFEDVLLAKLKESMGEDFEVEVAKPDGIGYPWQMSPRVIQDLAWFPLVPPVRKSLYVYSDELALLVRDKNEASMEFGDAPDPLEDDMEAYRPKNVLKSLPVPNNDRRETGLKLNLNKSPTKP